MYVYLIRVGAQLVDSMEQETARLLSSSIHENTNWDDQSVLQYSLFYCHEIQFFTVTRTQADEELGQSWCVTKNFRTVVATL